MSRTITISNDKDFAWLKDYIDRWQIKCQGSPAQYSEHVEMFNRLHDDFAAAKKGPDASLSDEIPDVRSEAVSPPAKAGKKGSRQKSSESPAKHEYNYCPTHPTYGAMRSPRTDCPECWGTYERLNPNRAHVAKAKFARKHA